MSRPTCAVIDLKALSANLDFARKLAPNKKVMAIVKADAYGHGLARVAHALQSADAYGVACLEEASQLRKEGIDKAIVLLEGPFTADELPEIARLELEIVIHEPAQIDMLERARLKTPLRVWLKIDTGMHRLGFSPEAVAVAWGRITHCPNVAGSVRLMTHLADAHARDDSTTEAQLACFQKAVKDLPGERCIANSAGLMAWPHAHADWVRPGLMLYGVSPFSNGSGPEAGLAPVMTLSSKLIAVKKLQAGDAVGYGGAWHCPSDMPVGIVAAGYGDGYPRHAKVGTSVLVNEVAAPLIGQVSMDMLTVDLGKVPTAKVGDAVVLWGKGLPVEIVARQADTIPYELLCGVNKRIRFIDDGTG